MKNLVLIASLVAISFQLNAEFNNEEIITNGNTTKTAEILYQKYWNLDTDGIPSSADPNENFGSVVVTGDFNSDSKDDIAIGIPGYATNTGAVVIIYGTSAGLSASGSQIIFVGGNSGDAFGYSLAAGDFNGDFKTDLAISAPFAEVGSATNAGEIYIYYGVTSALNIASPTIINAGTDQTFPDIEPFANFGWSMAAGDFNGDSKYELAVSMPNKTIAVGSPPTNISGAGLVRVFNGNTSGLAGGDFNDVFQGSGGVFGTPETDDRFGWSLAAGDFDRQGKFKGAGSSVNYDDLAIGVPYESFGATSNGIVQVFTGNSGGLSYSSTWSQADSTDESIEDGDLFGFTLAVGNVNGLITESFPDELIVGVPFEDIGATVDAGVVHIFYGSTNGLTTTGNQVISQASPGVFGVPEANDNFGLAITIGNFNNASSFFDYFDDLIIAAPGESYQASRDGVVTVIFGATPTLDTNNSQFLSNPSAHDDTTFGLSLTVANFNEGESFFPSLIVGIPGQSSLGDLAAGAILEIAFEGNELIFKHGFEPN